MGQGLARKKASRTQYPSVAVTKTSPLGVLRCARTDISFQLDRQGMLDVTVRLKNAADERSAAGLSLVEFAPFGAFLPWTLAGRIRVPSLRAGEIRTITARMPRPALSGAGEPPWRSPTAFVPPKPSSPNNESLVQFLVNEIKHGRMLAPYLAGNVHVHIGRSSVERHLSGPLRLYPGRPNIMCFAVGTGEDAYRIEFSGEGASWNPTVINLPDFVPGRWYERSALSVVLMHLMPPAACRSGTLDVHVEQRSTGRVAVVEFTLDVSALEDGCYTV